MRRLVDLHIGLHKTGTTSIQKFMFEAFSEKNHGISYPNMELGYSSISRRLPWLDQHSMQMGILFSEIHREHWTREIRNIEPSIDIDTLRSELLACLANNIEAHEHLVFSGEDICCFNKTSLEAMIAHLSTLGATQIRIILGIRSVYDWAASQIQQKVREGRLSLDESIIETVNQLFWLEALADDIISLSANSNTEILYFDLDKCITIGKSIEEVFLGLITGEEASNNLIKPMPPANSSIGLEGVQVMSIINTLNRSKCLISTPIEINARSIPTATKFKLYGFHRLLVAKHAERTHNTLKSLLPPFSEKSFTAVITEEESKVFDKISEALQAEYLRQSEEGKTQLFNILNANLS